MSSTPIRSRRCAGPPARRAENRPVAGYVTFITARLPALWITHGLRQARLSRRAVCRANNAIAAGDIHSGVRCRQWPWRTRRGRSERVAKGASRCPAQLPQRPRRTRGCCRSRHRRTPRRRAVAKQVNRHIGSGLNTPAFINDWSGCAAGVQRTALIARTARSRAVMLARVPGTSSIPAVANPRSFGRTTRRWRCS